MSHMANPLATPFQLAAYRKQQQRLGERRPLPTDVQDTAFFAMQALTQAAGRLLELPQSATAQASVLLARYWLVAEEHMAHEFSVSGPPTYLPPDHHGTQMSPLGRCCRARTVRVS
jgi:cyclin L